MTSFACRSAFSILTKLITSRALYHYDSAERCEVVFMISHFHMNNSAEEAFNLSTYLCSAHKLHNANVCAERLTHTLHSTHPY